MHLLLQRKWFTPDSTIGELFVNDKFFCYTLGDVERSGPKVYGKTAIPRGTYEIKLTHSPKYKRLMPLLLDVPGFEGVRIHSGNTHKDTEGCILVGNRRGPDHVGDSRKAYAALFKVLKKAQENEENITITIV